MLPKSGGLETNATPKRYPPLAPRAAAQPATTEGQNAGLQT